MRICPAASVNSIEIIGRASAPRVDGIGAFFTAAYRKDYLDAQVLADKSINQDSRVALKVGIIVRGFGIEAIPPGFDDPWRE